MVWGCLPKCPWCEGNLRVNLDNVIFCPGKFNKLTLKMGKCDYKKEKTFIFGQERYFFSFYYLGGNK